MAQIELTKAQGLVLIYFQKVKRTFNSSDDIGLILGMHYQTVNRIIKFLKRNYLIDITYVGDSRLIKLTEIGKKYLIIEEEL